MCGENDTHFCDNLENRNFQLNTTANRLWQFILWENIKEKQGGSLVSLSCAPASPAPCHWKFSQLSDLDTISVFSKQHLQHLNQNTVTTFHSGGRGWGEWGEKEIFIVWSFHLCLDELYRRFFVTHFQRQVFSKCLAQSCSGLLEFCPFLSTTTNNRRPPLAYQIQQCPHQPILGSLLQTPAVLSEVGTGVSEQKIPAHPIWPNPTLGPMPICPYRVPLKSAKAADCQHTNFIKPRSSWQFSTKDYGLKATSTSQKDRKASMLNKNLDHFDKPLSGL